MTFQNIFRDPSTRPVAGRIALIGMIAVLLVAAALRFHLLGAQSLWHDEGNSYVQATRSFSAIAENAARDIHPPGYYWLLAVWHSLTGDSEFALRMLSALASVVTVAVTYALARRMFGVMAAMVAALCVALNTFSIYYAQEARMYALLALWGAASVWALVSYVGMALHQGKTAWRWALALSLLNAAGLWTQYAFPFVMIAQGTAFVLWLAILVNQRGGMTAILRLLGGYVAANLLAIALYLPWLATAWSRVTTWPNTGEVIPVSEALSTILGYFGFGITVGSGTTVAVAFFLLFALLPRPDERSGTPGARFRRWAALVPVIWVVMTVGAFLALELFREANLKFLLPTQIAFALWIGRGVHVLWDLQVKNPARWQQAVPKFAAVFGVFLMLLQLWSGLNPLYHDPAHQRDDYRSIAAIISATPDANSAVILNAPNQQEVFDYYYTGDTPVYPLPPGLGGDDAATLLETQRIIEQSGRIYAVFWATEERDPAQVVENTLDAEAFEISSAWYGDVRLVQYAAPVEMPMQASGAVFGGQITLESYGVSTEQLSPGEVLQVRLVWSSDAALQTPYKVFVQLLRPDGVLVAQHDSEPGGGRFPTTTWQPGAFITDNHALIVPNDLPPSHYKLIIGIYNSYDPGQRLRVESQDFLPLAEIMIE